MAKKEDKGAAEVLQTAQEPSKSSEILSAEETAKRLAIQQEQLAKAEKDHAAALAKALEERYAKESAKRKMEQKQRTIPVIVQQRRDRPVKFAELEIACRTPTMVNRKELRRLEYLRSQGRIQLIVGELEKPAKKES